MVQRASCWGAPCTMLWLCGWVPSNLPMLLTMTVRHDCWCHPCSSCSCHAIDHRGLARILSCEKENGWHREENRRTGALVKSVLVVLFLHLLDIHERGLQANIRNGSIKRMRMEMLLSSCSLRPRRYWRRPRVGRGASICEHACEVLNSI